MICPTCKEENKKSKVYIEDRKAHAVPKESLASLLCVSFYDEEGTYHSHSPFPIIKSYVCSEGHTWSEKINEVCGLCPVKEDKNTERNKK